MKLKIQEIILCLIFCLFFLFIPTSISSSYINFKFLFLGISLLFLAVLQGKLKNSAVRFTLYDGVFIGFIAWQFLSFTWAAESSVIWNNSFKWLALYCLFRLIYTSELNDFNKQLWGYVFLAVNVLNYIFISFLILQAANDNSGMTFTQALTSRTPPMFSYNDNYITASMVVIFPMFFMIRGWVSSRIADLCLALHILFIICLQSRVSIATLFICIAFLLFYRIIGPVKKKLALISFLLVAAIAIISFVQIIFEPPEKDTSRISQLLNFDNDERVKLWNTTTKLIRERPILGWGSGNWKLQYPKYGLSDYSYSFNRHNTFNHAHNMFLEHGSELGVPGLMMLAFLALYPLYLIAQGRFGDSMSRRNKIYFYLFLTILSYSILSSFYGVIYSKSSEISAAEIFWIACIALYFKMSGQNREIKMISGKRVRIYQLIICALATLLLGWYIIAFINKSVHSNYATLYAHQNYELAKNRIRSVYNPTFNLFSQSTPHDMRLGILELRLGNRDNAIIQLNKAVALHPYHTMSWYHLGNIYFGLRDIPNARRAYETAHKLNNNLFPVRIRLAHIAILENDLESFDNYIDFYGWHVVPGIEKYKDQIGTNAKLTDSEIRFYDQMCGYQDRIWELLERKG